LAVNGNTVWHAGNLPSGSGVTSVATGEGLTGGTITTSGTISLLDATSTTRGGIKIRLSGSTLFITNNGSNA
jgi:hypothetical protein